MLSVVMLIVFILNVNILNVVMLSVIILNVIMLSVVMLSAAILNVVAPILVTLYHHLAKCNQTDSRRSPAAPWSNN